MKTRRVARSDFLISRDDLWPWRAASAAVIVMRPGLFSAMTISRVLFSAASRAVACFPLSPPAQFPPRVQPSFFLSPVAISLLFSDSSSTTGSPLHELASNAIIAALDTAKSGREKMARRECVNMHTMDCTVKGAVAPFASYKNLAIRGPCPLAGDFNR